MTIIVVSVEPFQEHISFAGVDEYRFGLFVLRSVRCSFLMRTREAEEFAFQEICGTVQLRTPGR